VETRGNMAKLNPKQQRFVAEYLVDLNATQAAIRAGYSKRTARQQASDLLSKPDIAQALREAIDAQQTRLEVKADDVLRELIRIGLADLGQAYNEKGNLRPIHDIPEDTRRALAGVKVFEEFEGTGADRVKVGEVREVKFWDKPRALELLGKHLGIFTEKIQHSGPDGKPIPLAMVVEFVKAPDGPAR
jgi:phage terminase small subunit